MNSALCVRIVLLPAYYAKIERDVAYFARETTDEAIYQLPIDVEMVSDLHQILHLVSASIGWTPAQLRQNARLYGVGPFVYSKEFVEAHRRENNGQNLDTFFDSPPCFDSLMRCDAYEVFVDTSFLRRLAHVQAYLDDKLQGAPTIALLLRDDAGEWRPITNYRGSFLREPPPVESSSVETSSTVQRPHRREPVRQALRWQLFKRDHFRCRYCGASPGTRDTVLVIDHVIPVKNGGSSTIDNLVTACERCNQSKAAGVLLGPPPPPSNAH
jgi:5-methylcytosine-specific restriction endonuclease McrA